MSQIPNYTDPSAQIVATWQAIALADIEGIGAQLTEYIDIGDTVYLNGAMGAGKTTLIKSIYHALGGDADQVTSPTFALIHEYPLAEAQAVVHLDLYRLDTPDALEYLGLRDYVTANHLILIEWWQNGAGYLPQPKWIVEIKRQEVDSARSCDQAMTIKSEQSELREVRLLCIAS